MSKTGSTFRPLNKVQPTWGIIHSDHKAGRFLIVHNTKKLFMKIFFFQTGKKMLLFRFGRFYLKNLVFKKTILILSSHITQKF